MFSSFPQALWAGLIFVKTSLPQIPQVFVLQTPQESVTFACSLVQVSGSLDSFLLWVVGFLWTPS